MPSNKENVTSSISSLYKALLEKREAEKELKRQQKEELIEEQVVEENKEDKVIKMSKKQRRQMEIDNWEEVIRGLVGNDLDFVEKKEKKKKYKKWIDDEDDNKVINVKPKKVKKKNYQKEFEPELNMLRTLVSEQNKFNIDLQKRFNNAMGPANKDAALPNKTMVELASAIVSGRNNSLGILREIGSLKKNIADLYMKQKKLNYDLKGEVISNDNNDLMLMGSSIMNSIDNTMFGQTNTTTVLPPQPMATQQPKPMMNNTYGYEEVSNATPSFPNIKEFDPSTWDDGPKIPDSQILFENIPKSIVVERNSQTGNCRFKAIRTDNGEEIEGFSGLPTIDPNTLPINEKDKIVKGTFDETYKLIEA